LHHSPQKPEESATSGNEWSRERGQGKARMPGLPEPVVLVHVSQRSAGIQTGNGFWN